MTRTDLSPHHDVLSAGGAEPEGAEGEVAEVDGGHAGLGGGGGPLELGGPGQGRLGRAAPGPQVRPADDDDDGR